ncbi:hypothetical protein LTS10_003610 [Elasticomyces elasticus]|nr:hypothetical protein LTS10_003610 [Elasticomyces elasticus]
MVVFYDSLNIKEMPAEDAWKMLEAADSDKDVDDIKSAMLHYARAYPDLRFEELEQVFRDAEMNTYLIAKQQEVGKTHTIVDFQGKEDQEYVVSIQFSAKPRRAAMAEFWPSSPEDNLVRLAKAGFPMRNNLQVCRNCEEVGHTSAKCEAEKREVERPTPTCQVCSETGHYSRDCKVERKVPGKKGCRNCSSTEHIAKECPEPPNPENVTCKTCSQVGHFAAACPEQDCRQCLQKGHHSRDCTNEKVVSCFNCGEQGHTKQDCKLPRKKTDWSTVQCGTCKEYGHSYKRCPQAEAGGDAGGDGGFGDEAAAGGESNGDGGW